METRAMSLEGLLAVLGTKPSSLIAGFLGGLVALPFMAGRRWWEKLSAVFAGTICAMYLAPWVSEWFGFDEIAHNGACFLVGIMGINIVAGLFALSDRFRKNPEWFLFRRKE